MPSSVKIVQNRLFFYVSASRSWKDVEICVVIAADVATTQISTSFHDHDALTLV